MKLIMVDLDGTLFDTREVNYLAYKDAISYFGYSIDYEYFCNYCNGRYYMDFLPKITTFDESVLNAMHNRKKQVYSQYLFAARLNTCLVDLLRSAKREYKTALVTTASKKNTYDVLDKFNLRNLFDLIFTHENVLKPKPNPEGYIKVMKYFDAAPEESIIFEDSDVGIEAAEKTGACCFVVRGFN